MTRGEMCEKLAKDYAKRASILSLSFEDAYDKYMKRLSKRTDDDIMEQLTTANLDNLPTRIRDLPKRYSREYIIKVNDDDCEDGVCKL